MNTVLAFGGTKRQRILAENVVNFCIEKLMPRMRTLDICINLEKFEDTDAAVGYCLAVDKREFVIEVNKCQTKEEIITTLTHEMVHVKQYARCELGVDEKQDDVPYQERWYEVEAYALQDTLAEEFQAAA